MLLDIPRSANFSAGDSILTTGFQGVFPADLLFGVVSEEAPFFDGEFLNVPVTWSTDFQALRYAQVAELKDRALLDDMENSMNDTQP